MNNRVRVTLFVALVALVGVGLVGAASAADVADGGYPDDIQEGDSVQSVDNVSVENITDSRINLHVNVSTVADNADVGLDSAQLDNINATNGTSETEVSFTNNTFTISVQGLNSFDSTNVSFDISQLGADNVTGQTGLTYDLNVSEGSTPDSNFTGQDGRPDGDDVQSAQFDVIKSADVILDNSNQTFDQDAEVNVSFNYTPDVNQSTIDVNVANSYTSEVTKVVESGDIVNGSDAGSTLADGEVRVDLPLQEGIYVVSASAEDTVGESNSSTVANSFTVNMSADGLDIGTDDSNPLAGENATVGVAAVDKNGNRLLQTISEGTIASTAQDLSLSTDPPRNDDNVTIFENFDDGDDLLINNSGNFNVTYDVNYAQAGDVSLEVFDTGNAELGSATATQTYTALVDSIVVESEANTLVADGNDTLNITATILDENGDPIPRSGEVIEWSTDNRSNAAVGGHQPNVTTNNEGVAKLGPLNASNAGFEVTYNGVHEPSSSSDGTTFETVPGEVEKLDVYLNGAGPVEGTTQGPVTVNTSHDLAVQAFDASDNTITGASVDAAANTSALDTTLETNSNGFANTSIQLPEEKQLHNFTISSGNASVSFEVDTQAAAAQEIGFTTDSRIVPVGGSQDVTVGALDEFGNVNESNTSTVDVSTSDDTVISIAGSASASTSLSSGTATFQLDAEDTDGSVDITAETDALGNVSDTFRIGQPDDIDVQVENPFVTDGQVNRTNVTAQLLDENGDAFEASGVKVNFARSGDTIRFVGDSNDTTDANGEASATIEARSDSLGSTDLIGRNSEFNILDDANVTVSGDQSSIELEAETDTAQVGDYVNVTTTLVDSQGRPVAIDGASVTVDIDGSVGALVDASGNTSGSVDITTSEDDEGLYNAVANLTANESGDVDLFAIGSDVSGEAQGIVTFEGGAGGAGPSSTIVADPNTPSNTSTHSVTATVGSDAGGSSLNGVEVDYSVGASPSDVSNVGQNDVVTATVAGTDVSDDLSGVSASNNGETVTVDFGGSYQLEQGDEVTVEYQSVQNPGTAGTFDVDVALNPQSANEVSTANLTIEEATTQDNPFFDENGNPLGELDVVDLLVEWNDTGEIDGVEYGELELVDLLVEWNDAQSGN